MKCPMCGGTGEVKTEQEWLQTATAEELAKFLSTIAYACMRCGMSNGEAYCHTGYCIQDEADALLWLKEKHKYV